MDLLDRYLQAVKKHLPWERQDDIIAELKANLEAQLEDKESELGRPLAAAETEAWLKRMGAPFKVAARYFPQQYLIGPMLFPTYWWVLRLSAFWSMVVYLIVSVLQIATQNPSGDAVLESVLRVPGILMQVAAWITLAFAALEYAATHYPAKCPAIAGVSAAWKPSDLPPLEEEAVAGKKPRRYSHAVAEVVFGFILLIWLLLIRRYPLLLIGPGAFYLNDSPFRLTSVWIQPYWWIVALNVVQLGWHSVNLLSGRWQRPQPLMQIAFKSIGLIPIALLLAVGDQGYLMLRHPELDQMRYGVAVVSLNQAIHLGLTVICAIVALQLAWDIGKLCVGVYRKRAAALR